MILITLHKFMRPYLEDCSDTFERWCWFLKNMRSSGSVLPSRGAGMYPKQILALIELPEVRMKCWTTIPHFPFQIFAFRRNRNSKILMKYFRESMNMFV